MLHLHLPQVLMLVAPLPALLLPAQVIRHLGTTLVWTAPQVLRAELVFWSQETLTADERQAFRRAFGQSTDLGQPMEDEALEGTMGTRYIPPECRVPDWAIPQVQMALIAS